jgi:hypothetical protein
MANERFTDTTRHWLIPVIDADVEEPEISQPVKPVDSLRPLWQYVVCGVLIAGGIALVVLFIKGFIDADDVDVSTGIHFSSREEM